MNNKNYLPTYDQGLERVITNDRRLEIEMEYARLKISKDPHPMQDVMDNIEKQIIDSINAFKFSNKKIWEDFSSLNIHDLQRLYSNTMFRTPIGFIKL